jgi:putative transcriptional regulator
MDQVIEPLASFPGPLDQDFRNSENDVQALRNRLRMSQTEFARRFGFSVATLRNWESGKRAPRGPSLALLRIIAYHPAIAMRAIVRARRAHERKHEPSFHPPRVPSEFANPRVIGDDLEP